ncbi:sugar ABC transporter substrate-binding protein [Kribbella sp. HUAS MG21]|uniref:Sugar ABC transporter substrate-binding protein n=1 Tax=Kribbella sp. HUAS MG21 TaxID=3160966 RepID=A0AAU7TE77_9ACTN
MITTAVRTRRRRIVAALSAPALVLTAALSGCASDAPAADGAGAASDDSGAMTLRFVNPLPSYPTWKQIGDCMKQQADKRGADLIQSGPTGQSLDAGAMIQQIQQAVANKSDAVMTFPASDGFTEVLKQAQSAGVVTGTIYGPGGPGSGADYNIGPDWTYIGESVVNAIAKRPGDHVLGLVAAANTGLGKLWLEGVKAAAAKTSNVKIAGEVYTGDDSAKALPQVDALLTAHPGITEIVTHMGTTTPGATSAIKSHGLLGKAFLVAVGHDNGGTEAMANGAANLMLLQDVCTLGKQLVDGVVDVHEGKKPADVPVKVAVVGKDEVQGYLDKGWV